MKKSIAMVLIAVGLVTGCTPTERGATIGAGTGALIGGLATGDAGGAIVGAAAGGIAGALIGRSRERPGYCIYRDRNGRRYEARCRD